MKFIDRLKISRMSLKIPAGLFLIFFAGFFTYKIVFSSPSPRWTAGDAQSYTFEMRTFTRSIDFRSGHPSFVKSEIRGLLNFKVFSVQNGIAKTGFQLEPRTVTVNGQTVKELWGLYSRPFFVEFSPMGEPQRIYTSKDITQDDEKYIKGLVYYLQYISSGGTSWKVEENDSNGRFLSSYTSGFSGIQKTRKKNQDPSSEKFGESYFIIKSQFVYSFDKEWSWISGVSALEKSKIKRDTLQITSNLEIDLSKHSKGVSPGSILSGGSVDFDKTVAELGKAQRKKESVWEGMRLESLKERLTQDSHLSLIDALKRKKIHPADFNSRMADYLKLYRNGAFTLMNMIFNKSVEDSTADLLMFAMGRAGTPECQKALVDLATAHVLSFNNRMKAAVYLGNVERAEISTVRAVESFPLDFSDKNSSMLSSAIVCTMGRMAVNSKNEGEAVEEINKFIRQRLEFPGLKTSEKCSILNAIGNTGNTGFIPEINRFRKSDNGFVRATAVTALAGMEGKEAETAILDSVKTDNDPMVRVQAIRTQEYRGYNEEFVRGIIDQYKIDKEADVRIEMVNYLKNFRGQNNDIVPLFKEALKTETDLKIRTKLLKAIHSTR